MGGLVVAVIARTTIVPIRHTAAIAKFFTIPARSERWARAGSSTVIRKRSPLPAAFRGCWSEKRPGADDEPRWEYATLSGSWPVATRVRSASPVGSQSILVAFIVGAVVLSTLDFGDDPQNESFEGDFFLALIPWAVAIFVAAEAVRWLRLESKRWRER